MEIAGRPDKEKEGQRGARCMSFECTEDRMVVSLRQAGMGKSLRGVLEKNQKQTDLKAWGWGGEGVCISEAKEQREETITRG